MGEKGQNRLHDPEDVLPDVEAFLADDNNLDTTIALFEAARRALHTPEAEHARHVFLRSMNLKITGKPSEPVTDEQKTTLMQAVTPIYAKHIFAAGRERDIPDSQLKVFIRNVINPNFDGEVPEAVEIESK